MKIKEYKYFVSYCGGHTDGHDIVGECVLTLPFKIKKPEDIDFIIKFLKIEQSLTNVVPLNYIRMK